MDTNSRWRVSGQPMDGNVWRPSTAANKTNPPPNAHPGGNNSNGHQSKLHQNVTVTVPQQAGNILQQKNKLVNAEYLPVNHQPSSHSHGVLNHTTYIRTHPPNNYHVTATSGSFSQSGLPPQQQQQQQITSGQAPLRQANLTTTASTLQTVSSQSHQPHQEHKMQQPPAQQQHQTQNMYHPNSYSRQPQQQQQQQVIEQQQQQPQSQYRNLPGTAPSSMPRNNAVGITTTGAHTNQINPRQPNAPQAAVGNYVTLVPHPVYQSGYLNAGRNAYQQAQYAAAAHPYSGFAFMQMAPQQHPQQTRSGNASVPGATQSVNHPPPQLSTPVIASNQLYIQQSSIQPRSTPSERKKFANRLQIIDPNSGADILKDLLQEGNTSAQSGTSTHSSALKIEAPSPSQTPLASSDGSDSQVPAKRSTDASQPNRSLLDATTNQPATESADSNVKNVPNPNAPIATLGEQQQCELTTTTTIPLEAMIDNSNIEEPPHTPIVSAITDGPSVDITPKQSKNFKRTNKSPEWLSSDKNPEYTSDNYSKVASTTSSSSNEWVKNNQNTTKGSSENENKGHQQSMQQKHHPKSKQSASNQYGASQSNKMKVHHEIDTRTANIQHQQQAPVNTQDSQHTNPQHIDSKNVAQTSKNVSHTPAGPKSHSQPQQSNKAINSETITQAAAQATAPATNVASTDEPLPNKGDQQKNSLGYNKQAENTSSSSSRNNESNINQPPHQQTPLVEAKVTSSDVNVSAASSNVDSTSNKEPIVENSSVNATAINPDSASSKAKSAINSTPDETDKAAENILDSNSNIKTNINSNVNKKPSLPNSLPSGFSSKNSTANASSEITSSTSKQQTQPSAQTTSSSQQHTERVESEFTQAPATVEASATATSTIESTTPQTSSTSKPELGTQKSSTTIDSSVNTKDSSNHVSSDNEASIDNGLAETINNIKNNNLTNSTSNAAEASATTGSNKINNNIVDKDLDNNLVNSTEKQQTSISSSTEQQKFKQPQQIARGNVPQTQAQLPNNVTKQPTKALLNYEEGQWSPDNTDGRKCYNRQQLVQLRDVAASMSSPHIQDQDQFQLIRKNTTNYPANANNNNNNNKNQSSSSNNRPQYNKRPSTQGQGGSNQQMSQGGGKGSKSGMIHVSLSLREDVKLNESANAWKPTFLGGGSSVMTPQTITGDPNNIELLCKRVRGILNKLTPEKFDPLLEQLQALHPDTPEKLSNVISLVFEKAIDEPNFSTAYAMLCQKLSKPFEEKSKDKLEAGEKTSKDSTQAVFKKELLNKCQTEFDNHVANEHSMRSKLLPLQNELNETTDANRKLELNAQLEEEERKLRRRSVGTVRFIGELYRQNMLLTSIMEWCIIALLKIGTEEKLECLCKLLTTVGQKMEHKTLDEEYDKKYYRDLTPHFHTMQQIASDKKNSKISNRVRFMLMDVIELRKNKWVPRRTDANPKKMGQIQKEAEQEQYKNQIAMMANNMGTSSGMGNNNMRKDNRDRNDRGGMRNDSRGGSMSGSMSGNKSSRGFQDTDGWIQQGSNKGRGGNTSTFDPTKFRVQTTQEDITKTSLGTPNQFQWKLNAQPQATSLTNSFSVLESDYKSMSANRSKEPYHSKGSMERERDRPGSRSGSQHGSRDNSAARNPFPRSSLQQMRPQMQFSAMPLGSSSSQKGIRSDSKLSQQSHQSLSSSSSSLSTSNIPSSSLTPASSDPKLSDEMSEQVMNIIKSELKNLLASHLNDEFRNYDDLDKHATKLEKIHENHRWVAVRELYNMAVDISGLKEAKRFFIGEICAFWINCKRITSKDYVRGLGEYVDLMEDTSIDVPKIYEWTAQMMTVTVHKNIVMISDLRKMADPAKGKLLGALLPHLAYEYGPQYVRDLWKQSKCKWDQFVEADKVNSFIERHKLKFVENPRETVAPPSTQLPSDRLRERIHQLVRKDSFSEKEVIEYIQIHVPTINKETIRTLTRTLIDASLDMSKGVTIIERVLNNCTEVLKNYIHGDDKLDLQVEALYAIQFLGRELEYPSGFIQNLFNKLYDICSAKAFNKWAESEEQGKGVVMKSLTQFFKNLNDEDEDDEEETK